jgi:hypothetical protein
MRTKLIASVIAGFALGLCTALVCGRIKPPSVEHKDNGRPKPTGVIQPRDMADSLHALIAAEREVYHRVIVDRLQNQEKVLKASPRWEQEHALPLPSQMLRLTAEAVQTKGAEFHYSLRSVAPINRQHEPETDIERKGLEAVARQPEQNFYSNESLGGRRYFTAVYADRADHPGCVACHNAHPASPRKDYRSGEVLGGIVVRVPLEF